MKYQTISLFAAKGAIYYVTVATVIFARVKIYMLFVGWEVRIVKNRDRGLEHFQGRGHSFSLIRTDPKPVNNLFIFLRTKNCFNFCKHKDKISRKRYRGP